MCRFVGGDGKERERGQGGGREEEVKEGKGRREIGDYPP